MGADLKMVVIVANKMSFKDVSHTDKQHITAWDSI